MIGVDTNILVYAHRSDGQFHEEAEPLLRRLAEGRAAWALPWPCIHEFFSVATHPRIYAPPSTTEQAVAQIDAWLSSPSLVLLGEDSGYWARLRALLRDGKVAGPRVHDARIAALCIGHGVTELWTLDRDFSRFPMLKTHNPLRGRN